MGLAEGSLRHARVLDCPLMGLAEGSLRHARVLDCPLTAVRHSGAAGSWRGALHCPPHRARAGPHG